MKRIAVDLSIAAGAFIAVVGLVCVFWVILLTLMGGSAWAHDIYTPLREKQAPSGLLCCGGDDPVRGTVGDCEGVTEYRVLPSGDVVMYSNRYRSEITVANKKIGWMAVPGGEQFPGHICAVPRSKVPLAPVVEDNADPKYWVYCAFLNPPGT